MAKLSLEQGQWLGWAVNSISLPQLLLTEKLLKVNCLSVAYIAIDCIMYIGTVMKLQLK